LPGLGVKVNYDTRGKLFGDSNLDRFELIPIVSKVMGVLKLRFFLAAGKPRNAAFPGFFLCHFFSIGGPGKVSREKAGLTLPREV
jgi:hypothetical protein